MSRNLHKLAEARSLALHREIARRIRADPSLVDEARQRLERWVGEGRVHPEYVQRWRAWLDEPLDVLIEEMLADTEEARAMRQSTPFAGVVEPRTRWRIWRNARDRFEAEDRSDTSDRRDSPAEAP